MDDRTSAPRLTVTPAAERFARRMLRLSGLPVGAGLALRVGPGGCSGYSTTFDVAAGPAPSESVLPLAEGLAAFVDAASARLLDGATLDFHENATEAGLRVSAAGAAACCGAAATGPAVSAVPLGAIGRAPRR